MAIKILYPQLSTLSIIMAIPITLYERRLGDNIQHIQKYYELLFFLSLGVRGVMTATLKESTLRRCQSPAARK